MADTNSQQDVTDTGLSDADDVSTYESADDIADSMDDVEVSTADLDEDESDEAATESEETDSTQSDDDANDDSEQSDESTDEEAEETADSDAERKRRNDEYARQRIAERQQREAEKRQAQMEYLQNAESEQDAAVRQLQIDAYNNRVQTNSDKLESQMDRALADIDLFKTGSNEVKQELANSLEDFERMYVVRDRNGDPVEVTGNLHQYLTDKAESIRRLIGDGARQEVKAKTKVKAKTDAVPTRTPKEPKKDPMLEAFDDFVANG